MKSGIIWAIIAVLILAALGWWYFSMNTPQDAGTEENSEVAGANDENEFVDDSKDGGVDVNLGSSISVGTYTVRYTDAGFVPSSLTVKKGSSVTFVDESTNEMWVGSDEHPSHTGYAGTSKDQHCVNNAPSATAFDQCGVSASYSFTFTKAGTWGYHNHRESDDHGSIVVVD